VLAEHSYAFALLREWVESQPEVEAPNNYQVQDIEPQAMAAAIQESYFANVEMVQVLAETYGFRAFFFWQPVLLAGDKPMTQDEEAALEAERTPAMAALFTEVYQNVAAQDRGNFIFLGAIFDEEIDGVYLDLVHVTPVGNALIAEAMLAVIE